jgi:DNA gyrase subunit A
VLACVGRLDPPTVAFFSSAKAHAYVCRIADMPASTGYGDPIQKLFKFDDGERIIAALALDPRLLDVPEPKPDAEPEPPFAVAVTRQGLSFRFSLRAHREPSTRAGRKFARLNEGDEVITVASCAGAKYLVAVANSGHALSLPLDELSLLSGAGKGVVLIKLAPEAVLLGAAVSASPRTPVLTARTEKGTAYEISAVECAAERASRGKELVKRASFESLDPPVVHVPELPAPANKS